MHIFLYVYIYIYEDIFLLLSSTKFGLCLEEGQMGNVLECGQFTLPASVKRGKSYPKT